MQRSVCIRTSATPDSHTLGWLCWRQLIINTRHLQTCMYFSDYSEFCAYSLLCGENIFLKIVKSLEDTSMGISNKKKCSVH